MSHPLPLWCIVVMSDDLTMLGICIELSYNAKLLATNLNIIISSLTHTSLSLFTIQIKQWYSYSDKSKLQTLRLTSTSYQPSSHDTSLSWYLASNFSLTGYWSPMILLVGLHQLAENIWEGVLQRMMVVNISVHYLHPIKKEVRTCSWVLVLLRILLRRQ